MIQSYRQMLAWSYRSRIGRPKQYGCKYFCREEKRIKLNQLWKIRKTNQDKTILFCRQCEYYTFERVVDRCYCCGRILAFAEVRHSKSRRINNEKKPRY